MKDLLYLVMALVSAVIAAVSFFYYRGSANTILLVVSLVFFASTIGFGAMYLSGRVNKQEDIHITE